MPTPTQPFPPPLHEAPLPPARETAAGVRVLSGVPYAAIPGIRPLELDLYLPPRGSADSRGDTPRAPRGSAPSVVFLHGGGWRLGSRRSLGPAYAASSPSPFEQLAAGGIAVASIDYRLSGEAPWPAQLHDAKAAVRWLRARSDELGLDTERIAAWGESAGGHLAALLGLTGRELDGDVGVTGFDSKVSAVVAWYTPSDLGRLAADTGADPMAADTREAQLLGAPLPTVPDLVAQASPLSHVGSGSPPFLLLHGRGDRFIPYAQSERFRDALMQAQIPVEVEFYDGADHMWLGSPAAAEQAFARTTAFLQRTLRS